MTIIVIRLIFYPKITQKNNVIFMIFITLKKKKAKNKRKN